MVKKSEKNNLMNIGTLDERKEKILFAIIKIYLETGEPVGSRAISKLPEAHLSSATIRNEMSDLTDMGYILQPHTSSGRIPSDKGYRMYVNSLMKEKDTEIKALRKEMTTRVDKLENMMKDLAQNIAKSTNYGALISGPTLNDHKIKFIQLTNLEQKKILAVVVCEGNIIKTDIIDTKKTIDAKEILDVSVKLNEILSGVEVSNLGSKDIIDKISQIKQNKEVVSSIVEAIKKAFESDNQDESIFTYGANNFFKYKELKENEAATSLLETFEKKVDLKKLIDESKEDDKNNAIKIYIGEESLVPSMKDCSVVTAKLDFGNGMLGTVGVVGPKRMDYEKVIKTLSKLLGSVKSELN